jgi:hypothetical protein
MKHEYHEGREAADKFEKMATRIFRAPKSSAKPVPKKHAVRKGDEGQQRLGVASFLSRSLRGHLSKSGPKYPLFPIAP